MAVIATESPAQSRIFWAARLPAKLPPRINTFGLFAIVICSQLTEICPSIAEYRPARRRARQCPILDNIGQRSTPFRQSGRSTLAETGPTKTMRATGKGEARRVKERHWAL